MLVLAKSILSLLSGFILSIMIGIGLIPFLKKRKVKQTLSSYLEKTHIKKVGTPTMGGFIFLISTLLIVVSLILMGRLEVTSNLLMILFVFVSYSLIGFIDDYLIIKRGNNIGLTELQKLFGQLLVALIFFFIFLKTGHDPILNIHTLGIKVHLGFAYGIFILFMLVASSNAFNITDGLDGLTGGLSLIAYLAFALIAWNSTWVAGNESIAIFCFILVGALMGFLFFNTHPAKIFMGDTGSLSLGATLASIAILTNHEVTFIIITGIFITETLSVLIQIFSVRYVGKKIFLMTPLHHHFEKLGWDETDIVKVFWFFGIILAVIGLLFAVWI